MRFTIACVVLLKLFEVPFRLCIRVCVYKHIHRVGSCFFSVNIYLYITSCSFQRTLTWRLENTYHSMTKDTVRWIINFALGKWQAVTNVNFREVLSGSADILVKFAPGAHGDPYAFDGRGGTLAHAYYPYRNYGICKISLSI